jgi:hypothetical protein
VRHIGAPTKKTDTRDSNTVEVQILLYFAFNYFEKPLGKYQRQHASNPVLIIPFHLAVLQMLRNVATLMVVRAGIIRFQPLENVSLALLLKM